MSETPLREFITISAGIEWEYEYPELVAEAKKMYQKTEKVFVCSLIAYLICIGVSIAIWDYLSLGICGLWLIITVYTYGAYDRARTLYWKLKRQIKMIYKPRFNV